MGGSPISLHAGQLPSSSDSPSSPVLGAICSGSPIEPGRLGGLRLSSERAADELCLANKAEAG